MKRKRYMREQIISILKEHEAGRPDGKFREYAYSSQCSHFVPLRVTGGSKAKWPRICPASLTCAEPAHALENCAETGHNFRVQKA